jgi:hypothetical protein
MDIQNLINDVYDKNAVLSTDFDDYKQFKELQINAGVRSHIGIINADNTVKVVFCHSEGELEKNGKKLLEFYNSETLAKQVVKYGTIKKLGKYTYHYPHRDKKDITVHDKYRTLTEFEYESVNYYIKSIKNGYFKKMKYFYLYGNDKTFAKTWWVSTDGKNWHTVSKKLNSLENLK